MPTMYTISICSKALTKDVKWDFTFNPERFITKLMIMVKKDKPSHTQLIYTIKYDVWYNNILELFLLHGLRKLEKFDQNGEEKMAPVKELRISKLSKQCSTRWCYNPNFFENQSEILAITNPANTCKMPQKHHKQFTDASRHEFDYIYCTLNRMKCLLENSFTNVSLTIISYLYRAKDVNCRIMTTMDEHVSHHSKGDGERHAQGGH